METSVIQGINQLKMDAAVQLTDNISDADALLALQSKLKKNAKIQAAAKSHDIPIYVTKVYMIKPIVIYFLSFIYIFQYGETCFLSFGRQAPWSK